MLSTVVLGLALAAMALTFALTNLALLAIRNPHRAGWVKSFQLLMEMLSVGAILVIGSILGGAIFAVFPSILVGGAVLLAALVGLFLGLNRFMRVDERLALCDEGFSPYAAGKGSKPVPSGA